MQKSEFRVFINKYHPKVDVREVVEIVSISTERVINILHDTFVHEKALCKIKAAIAKKVMASIL